MTDNQISEQRLANGIDLQAMAHRNLLLCHSALPIKDLFDVSGQSQRFWWKSEDNAVKSRFSGKPDSLRAAENKQLIRFVVLKPPS